MLQASATLAIALLIAREYFALDPAASSQRAAKAAGLFALPFLVVFAAIFASRVMGFLGDA